MRICIAPGCGRVIEDRQRMCEECKHASAGVRIHTMSDRQVHRDLYDCREWEKLRVYILRRDPVCQCDGCNGTCDCAGVCTTLSRIVDHIIPAGIAIAQCQESRLWKYNRNAGFFLKCNLRGLCDRCHAAKTRLDKTHVGPWPSVPEMWRKWKDERKANT